MAGQSEEFNVRAKLKMLRTMIPDCKRYLVPHKIISDLSIILDADTQRRITEKEKASREEAVEILMDAVLEKKEQGLNLFIYALKKGEESGLYYERFYNPLMGSSSSVDEQTSMYFAFIVRILQGDIIRNLSPWELSELLLELYTKKVIDEDDMEEVQSMTQTRGAQQLFTVLLPRYTQQWPLKLFESLLKVKPELLRKIDPLGESPVVHKDSGHDLLRAERDSSDNREQTVPKQHVNQPESSEQEAQECVLERDFRRNSVESFCDDNEDDGDAAGRAGFSDEEKQDVEGNGEKCDFPEEGIDKVVSLSLNQMDKLLASEKVGAPSPKIEQELALRNYQHELSQNALEGRNTIICAPTGSGKTRVALHIVKEHLTAAHQGRARKVVFLARTVPLVSQQHRNFKKYLPQYECELVTGESENNMTVHHLLEKKDILVLTPKILENHLRPDKIPSLAAFTLIIFDECHHTRKGEPYNSVMKHYLKTKKQDGADILPQIVGLTASIGVEKATTSEEAKESILGIMGNLDVRVISEVKEHVDELHETVPRPEESKREIPLQTAEFELMKTDLVELVPREGDDVSNSISNTMMKIIEELKLREKFVHNVKAVEELTRILSKQETDLRCQKFSQWAHNLWRQARLLKYPKTPKDSREQEQVMRTQVFAGEVQVLSEWLVAYNEAFDVHYLTRPGDVLQYLDRKSRMLCEDSDRFISTELEEKVKRYYTEVQKQLTKFKAQRNPNLAQLESTILKHIKEAEDNADSEGYRILVFVRTRATCMALCSWLNDKDTVEPLRNLNAKPFTGTGAHQEHGGMTLHEQVETLTRFKTGDVKLLATTSVGEEGIDIADCNLTIRYNHVGNEVTTVQTRGRSRKKGGRSILMAMPKIIEQELGNRKREQLMHAGLDLVNRMSPEAITNFVTKVQQKALEVDEIEQIAKKVKQLKREAGFSIACPKCMKVKLNGAQIRSVNKAHHVIIGHDIDDELIIMPGKTFLKKDDWEMQGSVFCRCKNKLGQLLLYKKARFIIVSPKYWVFLDKNGDPSHYKQWNKVPYPVDEFHPRDLKEHLGIPVSDDDDGDEGN